MLRIFIIGIVFAACHAAKVPAPAPPTTPATPPAVGVRCGDTPSGIISCLSSPKVLKPEVSKQCDISTSECDRMKCIFRKSDWLDGDAINKTKIMSYFDEYAKESPAWSPAVQQVKTNCLTTDLQPQGVYVNCPAYDIVHCILSNFIKNAQPSQWSTAPNCEYPRQFAAACPICPSDCFAPLIPNGSCNACRVLPRSP